MLLEKNVLRSGFSLVEVVLALGIAAFALVTIVALVPMGLKLAGESSDESRAINLISAISSDRRNTPLTEKSAVFQLPELTGNMTGPVVGYFGVDDDDRYTGQDMAKARYRIDYVVTPVLGNSLSPYTISLKVAWPALSVNSPTTVETVVSVPKS